MKKWIIFMLCLLLAVSCLTGCDKDTVTEELPEQTEQTEQVQEQLPAEELAGQTLIVYTALTESDPAYAAYVEQVAKFEEATGATVQVSHYGENLPLVLDTALKDGSTVDVFEVETLSQLSTRTTYAMDLSDREALSNAYPILLEHIKTLSGGNALYAVPYGANVTALWYNKAAFEAAGVSGDVASVEDFEALCDDLVAAGYQPMALDSAYIHSNFGIHMERALGAETLSSLVTAGGWADNADAVDALQAVIDWVGKGYFDENAPADWPFSQLSLADRTAVIYADMEVLAIAEEMLGQDLQWDCFPYPGNSNTVKVDCGGLCINAETQVAELAWQFVDFMTSGEADKAICEAAGTIPNDASNASDAYAGAQKLLANAQGICDAGVIVKQGTDLTEVLKALYAGTYADGAEAAAALDALYE